MPGTDPRETARQVTDILAAFPFLPELPARGPGADMIGRTAGALLTGGLTVELLPSGWRLDELPHAPRDARRAAAHLREDLDALEEFTQGFEGPLKVQAVGPWTLAATLELRSGQPVLADRGARRDLAVSLAEGLRGHLAEVRRRIPGARPVLQLDEPSLPAVQQGRIRTASGFGTVPAPDKADVESVLKDVIGALDAPAVVHCCAPGTPIALLHRAGAAAVAVDMSLLTERDEEPLGELIESGRGLLAGAVATAPTTGDTSNPRATGLSDPGGSVGVVRTLWRRLGLDPRTLPASVAVTPACGLAGASPRYARSVLEHCVRAAKTLHDDPEG
ncbi:methionine synthase [Mangrovactinospora gilvigrisea]|uniref:Methionine synthase n=2 Tax=Mangrovactinospora gilvigrisea TaxID=1428644 RepID=A0A1J7CAS2_9ACTN|nr:methionine synthase [Mangrovactinospora gilvigrisea]